MLALQPRFRHPDIVQVDFPCIPVAHFCGYASTTKLNIVLVLVLVGNRHGSKWARLSCLATHDRDLTASTAFLK